MSEPNGAGAPKLPTATIADDDAAINRFTASRTGDDVLLIFENPDGSKFGLAFKMKIAAVLSRLCHTVVSAWHHEHQGNLFIHPVAEASVSTTDDLRGHVALQFEKGIAYILPTSVALSLADLLTQTAMKTMTEDERVKHNQRKAPLIVQPRHRLITR